MLVKSRPNIDLSESTIEMLRDKAFKKQKSLSCYLAELILLGYQSQNVPNNL